MKGNTTEPLITVAVPVYNAGKYLRPAVMSILAQTITNWELLVIDDNSTDNSLDSIADIRDPRVRVLRDGSNRGLAARLNQAIDLARGQFFARMDQDDISYPERFARQLELLGSDSHLDLVAVRAMRISEQNAMIGPFPSRLTHPEICARPWQGFYLPHPTWMGRIEWFRKYRYMIPEPYFCEDQELLLRSHRDSKFACVPEILFAYRVRDRINPKKLRGTRWALFKAQISYFLTNRQFHYIALAIAVLLMRMVSDLVKQAIRRAPPLLKNNVAGESMDYEARRWEQLKQRFFGSNTAPQSISKK